MSTNDNQRHFGRVQADEIDTTGLVVGTRGTDLSAPWTEYTPTVTNTGGVVGAGTVTRVRYQIVGRTLNFQLAFIQASGGTAGSGSYNVSFPRGLNIVTAVAGIPIGPAILTVGSTTHMGSAIVNAAGTGFIVLVSNDTVAPAFWGSALGGLNASSIIASASGAVEIV